MGAGVLVEGSKGKDQTEERSHLSKSLHASSHEQVGEADHAMPGFSKE